jgi:hypothetical protein
MNNWFGLGGNWVVACTSSTVCCRLETLLSHLRGPLLTALPNLIPGLHVTHLLHFRMG